ncbi:hypothetical protein VS28_18580, partial [Vibrio cholerae O1 biovar El Tor]
LWGLTQISPGNFPGKFGAPFPKGETPGFKPRGLKGPLLGVLNPKFSPGGNFPRGNFGAPFPPKGETPGVLNPGVLKGPFWGFKPQIFPGEIFPPGENFGGPLFPPKGGKPPGVFKTPGGFKRGPPFWGFLKPPKIFPPGGKIFPPGGKFLGGPPFSPQKGGGKPPGGFLKPPGGVFKKGGPPFFGGVF